MEVRKSAASMSFFSTDTMASLSCPGVGGLSTPSDIIHLVCVCVCGCFVSRQYLQPVRKQTCQSSRVSYTQRSYIQTLLAKVVPYLRGLLTHWSLFLKAQLVLDPINRKRKFIIRACVEVFRLLPCTSSTRPLSVWVSL